MPVGGEAAEPGASGRVASGSAGSAAMRAQHQPSRDAASAIRTIRRKRMTAGLNFLVGSRDKSPGWKLPAPNDAIIRWDYPGAGRIIRLAAGRVNASPPCKSQVRKTIWSIRRHRANAATQRSTASASGAPNRRPKTLPADGVESAGCINRASTQKLAKLPPIQGSPRRRGLPKGPSFAGLLTSTKASLT